MRKKFDVLALGAVAVDDLFYIDSYPAPDEKAPILRRERRCGGMSAIAAITASRLGCRSAYAGVLGRDELSEFAIKQMRQEGVNLRHLARRDCVRCISSIYPATCSGSTWRKSPSPRTSHQRANRRVAL